VRTQDSGKRQADAVVFSRAVIARHHGLREATPAVAGAAAFAFVAPLFGPSISSRLSQSPRQTKASGFLRNRALIETPLSVSRIRYDARRTKGGRICVTSSNPLRPCTASSATANYGSIGLNQTAGLLIWKSRYSFA
jgi:hypothetical protein